LREKVVHGGDRYVAESKGFWDLPRSQGGGGFSPPQGRGRPMPQLHLPMFPSGVIHITDQLAVMKKDGAVTYFTISTAT
jgi:hypothetical protein